MRSSAPVAEFPGEAFREAGILPDSDYLSGAQKFRQEEPMETMENDRNNTPADPSVATLREKILLAVLFIATAVLLYLAYQLTRPFLPALAWALALAIVSFPLYRWIQRRVRSGSAAAGVAVILVAVVIVAPAIFIGHQVAGQLASTLENFRSDAFEQRIQKLIQRSPAATRVYSWAEQRLSMGEALSQGATVIGQRLTAILTGSVAGVLGLLVTFFFLFYFLRDAEPGLARIRSGLPLSNHEVDRLFSRVYDTIKATVFGSLAVAAAQGALGGLIFWWLGLPAPLLWGVVMALLAVVPVLGPFLVWIPAAIYLAIEGHWIKAVILSLWGTVVIGLIDNLLYPVLVGRKLQLHTLLVFISVLGGLLIFGASGVILGPVILALNMAIFEVWKSRASQGELAQVGDRPAETGVATEEDLQPQERDLPEPAQAR